MFSLFAREIMMVILRFFHNEYAFMLSISLNLLTCLSYVKNGNSNTEQLNSFISSMLAPLDMCQLYFSPFQREQIRIIQIKLIAARGGCC